MTTAHVLSAFAQLTTEQKNEILPTLAKDTPNRFNPSDYHVVATTTYLSNILNIYCQEKETGQIPKNTDGSDVFVFIDKHF